MTACEAQKAPCKLEEMEKVCSDSLNKQPTLQFLYALRIRGEKQGMT
jgi:hypothetical protein